MYAYLTIYIHAYALFLRNEVTEVFMLNKVNVKQGKCMHSMK
jgi:hypothetical protein